MTDINFHDYFYYDETSPSCLRWKVDIFSGRMKNIQMVAVGDEAGWMSYDGYYRLQVNDKNFLVHRVIWMLHHEKLSSKEYIDHIDRNRSNSKISNLRIVTWKENMRNKKPSKNNKSGVNGVFVQKTHGGKYKTWTAIVIDLDGKKRTKSFSFNKYGEEEAFRLACEYRAKMIEELNEQGAGYTDRHGT